MPGETSINAVLSGALLESRQNGVKEGILNQIDDHLPCVSFGVL